MINAQLLKENFELRAEVERLKAEAGKLKAENDGLNSPQWFYDDCGDNIDVDDAAADRSTGDEFTLFGARDVGEFKFRVFNENDCHCARIIGVTRSPARPAWNLAVDLSAMTNDRDAALARAEQAEDRLEAERQFSSAQANEIEKLKAEAAAMMEALSVVHQIVSSHGDDDDPDRWAELWTEAEELVPKALSSTAGRDLLAERERLREALEVARLSIIHHHDTDVIHAFRAGDICPACTKEKEAGLNAIAAALAGGKAG